MHTAFAIILGAGCGLALLVAACTDLRSRTIPNGLTAGLALAAPLWWWANGLALWPDIAGQILFAVLVFALFTGAFALRAMGGGDVKLIGALALWLPWEPAIRMLFLMSVLGGVLTVAMVIHARVRKSSGAIEVPYGLAISCAGLWAIGERYLYHFG
ncbi:MAG: prepilin peptidase [Sphingomonadaceae bacterium]|nr:prepilin peptidase [Sphingomonadaceae bacterium]